MINKFDKARHLVPLGAFCNTFDLHIAIICLENQFVVFLEWPFYNGFTVFFYICSISTWGFSIGKPIYHGTPLYYLLYAFILDVKKS